MLLKNALAKSVSPQPLTACHCGQFPVSASQAQLASGEEQRKSLEEQVTEAVSRGLSAEEELAAANARMARYLHTDAQLLTVSSALEQAGAEAGVQQQAVMQVCVLGAHAGDSYPSAVLTASSAHPGGPHLAAGGHAGVCTWCACNMSL